MTLSTRQQFVLRLLGGLALIAAVLWTVDFRALGREIVAGDFLLLGFALAVFALRFPVWAYRQAVIVRKLGGNETVGRLLVDILISLGLMLVTPSSLGGEGYRIYAMCRRGAPLSRTVLMVALDRWFGLLAMLPFLAVSVFYLVGLASTSGRSFASASLVVILFAACVFLLPLLLAAALAGQAPRRHDHRVPSGQLRRIVEWLRSHAEEARGIRGKIIVVLLISLLFQTLSLAAYVVVAASFGVMLSPWAAMALVPLIWLAALIPLAPGGLGIRETATVALFVGAGATPLLAASIAAVMLAYTVAFALFGGVLALYRRAAGAPSSAAQ
jgi:uncharacterized protein (TIRG00374 family)